MSEANNPSITQIINTKLLRGREPQTILADYNDHMRHTLAVDFFSAALHDRFTALAGAIRDRLADNWLNTQNRHHGGENNENPKKRVYYLSLEFLIGRSMGNSLINMGMLENVRKVMKYSVFGDPVRTDVDYELEKDAKGRYIHFNWWRLSDPCEKKIQRLGNKFTGEEIALLEERLLTGQLEPYDLLRDEEVDAGLGNGGLGRLAACFLDSLATLGYPAFGYGLRYNFGIFNQAIDNCSQVEHPDDWLSTGNPWEIARPHVRYEVGFGGKVVIKKIDNIEKRNWEPDNHVIGMAYDMPVVGYGGTTVNTLRLWSSRATDKDRFDFQDFNQGKYEESIRERNEAENITQVLYPNDNNYSGKELRLKQQYVFICCSLQDIIRRFKNDSKGNWDLLPKLCAIQMNDTHPALAVAELMRILVDENGLDWDRAWKLVVDTMGYTNHTLMSEALEKWPRNMMKKLLPRHEEIICEINIRFIDQANKFFYKDTAAIGRVSIFEGFGDNEQIRMAHLAIVGSHSINGVAAIHTRLLQERLVPDFARIFPKRFNNKTNGITPRRWLLKANPELSALITKTLKGDKWITDLSELSKLAPCANDSDFRRQFLEIKHRCKVRLADHMKRNFKFDADPNSIFDVQVKRLHEYKRQLLNVMHIIIHYNRLKKIVKSGHDLGKAGVVPRTFLFGAKAAPGYETAKLIIRFINMVADTINKDEETNRYLKAFFLPNYRVSLAELIIPAADISEQISTAGTEASGTGNMKFMMNGALTIGTMDGANVEIFEEVERKSSEEPLNVSGVRGDNIFIFGLTADQVIKVKPNYNAKASCYSQPEVKEMMNMIFERNYFSLCNPDILEPLRHRLFDDNDPYLHFADIGSYIEAQEKAAALYANPDEWARKAILNIAYSGKFSSDRTIREYATCIWNLESLDGPERDRQIKLREQLEKGGK